MRSLASTCCLLFFLGTTALVGVVASPVPGDPLDSPVLLDLFASPVPADSAHAEALQSDNALKTTNGIPVLRLFPEASTSSALAGTNDDHSPDFTDLRLNVIPQGPFPKKSTTFANHVGTSADVPDFVDFFKLAGNSQPAPATLTTDRSSEHSQQPSSATPLTLVDRDGLRNDVYRETNLVESDRTQKRTKVNSDSLVGTNAWPTIDLTQHTTVGSSSSPNNVDQRAFSENYDCTHQALQNMDPIYFCSREDALCKAPSFDDCELARQLRLGDIHVCCQEEARKAFSDSACSLNKYVFQYLLKKHQSFIGDTVMQRTLEDAIESKDDFVLQKILENYHGKLRYHRMLVAAVQSKNYVSMNMILELRSSKVRSHISGTLALETAAAGDDLESVKILLGHGPLNLIQNKEKTFLAAAALKEGSFNVLGYFLDNPKLLAPSKSIYVTAILNAGKADNDRVAQMILSRDNLSINYEEVLRTAVLSKNYNSMRSILKWGRLPENFTGKPALLDARFIHDQEAVNILEEYYRQNPGVWEGMAM